MEQGQDSIICEINLFLEFGTGILMRGYITAMEKNILKSQQVELFISSHKRTRI